MDKKEKDFQRDLIKEIKEMFPGCYVHKTHPIYQGIPDITILFDAKWATLEAKRAKNSSRQANQPYHVDKMNQMSFSRFIHPGNRKQVLDELYSFMMKDRIDTKLSHLSFSDLKAVSKVFSDEKD